MHLIVIPIEELNEATEIKEGLQTLLPEVLLLNATEDSLEFLRKKQEDRNVKVW